MPKWSNEAFRLAERLSAGPTQAFGKTKRLLAASLAGFESQMVLESETIATQAVTPEGAEGINAFIDKRKAGFSRMTWVVVAFVVAAAIIIARIFFKIKNIRSTKQESWDAKIIEQLRSKGYAPFNEYKVDFFLALPDEGPVSGCARVSSRTASVLMPSP